MDHKQNPASFSTQPSAILTAAIKQREQLRFRFRRIVAMGQDPPRRLWLALYRVGVWVEQLREREAQLR